MKHRGLRSGCPIHFALETVGDSWTLLIVRDLLYSGGATYTELLRAKEKIATNILADRLARLEKHGIVARQDDDRARYRLTAKGMDLVPILREMLVWAAKHDPKTSLSPSLVRRLRHGRGDDDAAILAELRARRARREKVENRDG